MPHRPLKQTARQLETARAWVRTSCADVEDYDTDPITKLRVIDAFLQQVNPQDTWKLQALGVVLGDAMALQYGLRWVEVEDEFGTDPALFLGGAPGEEAYAFPLTMIAKRRQEGRDVDLQTLAILVDQVGRSAVQVQVQSADAEPPQPARRRRWWR